MICPHCHQTIREEQEYLMSRRENSEPPGWLIRTALVAACWLAILLVLAVHAG